MAPPKKVKPFPMPSDNFTIDEYGKHTFNLYTPARFNTPGFNVGYNVNSFGIGVMQDLDRADVGQSQEILKKLSAIEEKLKGLGALDARLRQLERTISAAWESAGRPAYESDTSALHSVQHSLGSLDERLARIEAATRKEPLSVPPDLEVVLRDFRSGRIEISKPLVAYADSRLVAQAVGEDALWEQLAKVDTSGSSVLIQDLRSSDFQRLLTSPTVKQLLKD